ncbi:transcription factor MYB124-like isoform X2 [Nymphaea colorata]|uniref:transcription factor MYB124-like isoform X2 n=1 Tax=Nymphaea colorata TaxID=210225 RepID=UPI00129ECBFB|nr:transcription factor MYB124-like isoform X2 [Nymphaea colorata]
MRVMGSYDSCKIRTMHKSRHIVTWTPEEDEILREQIRIRGTESWKDIAANFRNKTSRQCRRRWYAYLTSDCKKGGWSEEEDRLLCEAQKMYGNKWTEIAKVVSGRTDNAVKNRFTTLCKKRAKYETSIKENQGILINSNHGPFMLPNQQGAAYESYTTLPLDRIRIVEEMSALHGSHNDTRGKSKGTFGSQHQKMQNIRSPLGALDLNNLGKFPTLNIKEMEGQPHKVATSSKAQGIFLRKDDPKVTALMQQAELLSSLAIKVNAECSEKSLEDAWKELQEFLQQNKENGNPYCKFDDMDLHFEDFKELVEDLKNGNLQLDSDSSNHLESQMPWREYEMHTDSQVSSDCSIGSHVSYPALDELEQYQTCSLNIICQSSCNHQQDGQVGANENGCSTEAIEIEASYMSSTTKLKGEASVSLNREFCSPLQSIPFLRSYADGIPTPEFSASERRFLLRTLGVTSPSPASKAPLLPQPSQRSTPPCRRALLHNF